MHRWLALLALTVLMATAGACGEAVPGESERPSAAATPDVAAARERLRSLIEDVTSTDGHRYRLTDDLGHEMDGAKVLQIAESGGFVSLYHSYRGGIFSVHLATSTNLLDWTWQVQLADRASMPTILPASDGGFAAAWEQEPDNHLLFAWYQDWPSLLAGEPSKVFEPRQQLSDCAEGTPNLYAASSTFLDVGFHFYDACDIDRQAHGTSDWTTFIATPRRDIEDAVRANGVEAGVGDRDIVEIDGVGLTLIEGMQRRDDWRTWDVYLYDDISGLAEPLVFTTHAGSTAFTNPTVTMVGFEGRPTLVMTLFLPQEGAHGDEAGELLYYRFLDQDP